MGNVIGMGMNPHLSELMELEYGTRMGLFIESDMNSVIATNRT
jgi:hypothetical protein